MPQWPTQRLKYASTINDEALHEDTDPDFELQYIDIGNVDSSGIVHDILSYRFADAPSRARRKVCHGDVIISTVRTYLQAIAPIESPPNNMIVSTGFAVVRPRDEVLDVRFCKYALREPAFLMEVEKRSVGVSYPAINSSELGNIPVYLPPLPAQRQIAAYLDRETVKIDALIAAKVRLLGLLAEKRRELITHAVTRGLNPKASLRDSGIPWLGKIPAHWETERTKWLFIEREERSVTGEEEMLTVSHITGVTPRSEKNVNMFEADSTEGYKVCCAGDLVINTLWAWMGAMGVSPMHGIVSPAYHIYTPCERLDPAYVDALVRIPVFAQEVIRFSKGVWSSRLRLYPEGLYEICLPVPPRDEQRAIVAHIATETKKLDALREAAGQTIALSKERRAALIAAAVTGKIAVEEISYV